MFQSLNHPSILRRQRPCALDADFMSSSAFQTSQFSLIFKKILWLEWKMRWPKMPHSVWKKLKCRIRPFKFRHFPPIFVLIKVTCLVTLFERKLDDLKNSPKLTIFGIFNQLLSTLISRLNLSILAFSTNLCPFQIDLSSNTIWLQSSVSKSSQNSKNFFWSVKWDFFCDDFQTPWKSLETPFVLLFFRLLLRILPISW